MQNHTVTFDVAHRAVGAETWQRPRGVPIYYPAHIEVTAHNIVVDGVNRSNHVWRISATTTITEPGWLARFFGDTLDKRLGRANQELERKIMEQLADEDERLRLDDIIQKKRQP